jgi:signal transduction histidine kinase/ActR/RegA family two-component response regulator
MSRAEPARRIAAPDGPTATLEEIDIRAELASRPHRPPDYERERRALALLAREMAENPRNMLQKLVELALELCDAGTAGISLLEGDVFRWEALAGVFAGARNSTMPRDASPCGTCIGRNATQLMYLPDRHFPALYAEPRFVEALLIPFHDHGRPIGTVWIVTHDFERKFDLEDERVVQGLAQFASAGWQLWRAGVAAEAATRRKDEFLAMLGHELRNPLAAIVSATAMLETLVAHDDVARQSVDRVARQSRHLSQIVDDLLDVSRISQGILALKRTPVDLRALVTEAVEATRPQIARRHHALSVEQPRGPIHVDADPVRVTQMLSNLLDNAAKYTPDGGHVGLSTQVTDGHVTVVVTDDGVGIAESQLHSIFDLFTQLRGPDGRPGSGLGLGLTLVRRLAEMHGGSVDAASDGPGRGSRFTLRLPTTITVPESAPPPTALAVATTSQRILVVEDNDDVATSLALCLSLDGHTVTTVSNGLAALEAMPAFAPDIMLLDVGLPGMSGYEVARRVRQSAGGPDVVIITLSGYGREEDRARSQRAGCDSHCVKPLDAVALRALVDRTKRVPRQQTAD